MRERERRGSERGRGRGEQWREGMNVCGRERDESLQCRGVNFAILFSL